MKKKILSLFLALAMVLPLCPAGLFSIEANATQSKSENFSKEYKLTGNYRDDIVAVAMAQNQKSKKDLGYTENWCADFVYDCAKLAGITNYPFYGGAGQTLVNKLVAIGGRWYSYSSNYEPRKGDIVFLNTCKKYASSGESGHVGIVTYDGFTSKGKVKTIEGNTGPEGSGGLIVNTKERAYMPSNYKDSSYSSSSTMYIVGFVSLDDENLDKCSHTYSNACDSTCNSCGATRTPAAHKYDNNCDTSCNVCGATRTITHSYTTVGYDDTHPHKEYKKCSCGAIQYTGAERNAWDEALHYDEAHPHYVYQLCIPCGWKEYNGRIETATVSTCVDCHAHSYTTVGYDDAHPHKEYKKCSCGAIQYTGAERNAWDEALHYDEAHPHYVYQLCIPCGWKEYNGRIETATVSTCVDCYPRGTTGDCSWILDGTKLTISGNGATADYTDSNPAPWGTDVTEVVIGSGVTRLGNQLLEDCEKLTSVTIPGNVKAIGIFAFYNCKSLKSVTIGNGVETIEHYAFRKCISLTSITIPESVTDIGSVPFSICDALSSITVEEGNKTYHSSGNCIIETASQSLIQGCNTSVIPSDNSVTSIYNYAFYDCDSLESIAIPSAVISVGEGAFYDCDKLTDVWYEGNEADRAKMSIDPSNEKLTDAIWHYKSCIKNAPSYTHVYDNACDTSCNVCGATRTITHSYTTVGYDDTHPHNEYKSCSCGAKTYTGNCEKVITCLDCCPLGAAGITGDCSWFVFGTTLEISGNGAMADYIDSSNLAPWGTAITEVVIGNGVTSIGWYAFEGCTALTSVTIGNSVTSIGGGAFRHCENLTSITIPDSVKTIGTSAFSLCKSLESITIPDSVKTISDSAFSFCKSLESITIPNSVTDIGHGAFISCTSLTSVKIPNGVVSIGDRAFFSCTSLTSFAIPGSVTFIGYWAFYNCTALTEVWYEGNEADRAKMSIDPSNEKLIDAIWHYKSCIKNAPSYTHTYDNACDAECNVCKATRTPAAHVYDNGEDKTCNVCGASRGEKCELIVTLSKNVVAHGDTITVSLSLSKSVTAKGFGLSYLETYDHDAFEWVSGEWSKAIRDEALIAQAYAGTDAVFVAQEPIEVSGEIFSFTLRVKSDVKCGTYKIETLEITQLENVTIVGASFTVDHFYDNDKDATCNVCGYERVLCIPGDVNDDGVMNMDDAIHLLFHANFPNRYTVNQESDFDGSGKVDMDDAIYLLFHVNFPERYPLN